MGLGRKKLEAMRVPELKGMCRDAGVTGYSKMTKAELVSALAKRGPRMQRGGAGRILTDILAFLQQDKMINNKQWPQKPANKKIFDSAYKDIANNISYYSTPYYDMIIDDFVRYDLNKNKNIFMQLTRTAFDGPKFTCNKNAQNCSSYKKRIQKLLNDISEGNGVNSKKQFVAHYIRRYFRKNQESLRNQIPLKRNPSQPFDPNDAFDFTFQGFSSTVNDSEIHYDKETLITECDSLKGYGISSNDDVEWRNAFEAVTNKVLKSSDSDLEGALRSIARRLTMLYHPDRKKCPEESKSSCKFRLDYCAYVIKQLSGSTSQEEGDDDDKADQVPEQAPDPGSYHGGAGRVTRRPRQRPRTRRATGR